MTMMVYPGPDGHHAGIFDGAGGSGGRADMYREPVSSRAVPIAVQLEHDISEVEPEITRFSPLFRPLSTRASPERDDGPAEVDVVLDHQKISR